MNANEDLYRSPETPGAGPCPRCGEPLSLLVEPGVAEFCCPEGHPFPVAELLSEQAAAARSALGEALRVWEARREEMTRLAAVARASGKDRDLALCERRLLVVGERLATIRRALAKHA
jgi:hypothetical protein